MAARVRAVEKTPSLPVCLDWVRCLSIIEVRHLKIGAPPKAPKTVKQIWAPQEYPPCSDTPPPPRYTTPRPRTPTLAPACSAASADRHWADPRSGDSFGY